MRLAYAITALAAATICAAVLLVAAALAYGLWQLAAVAMW